MTVRERLRLGRGSDTAPVPTSTGPDEATVRLARKDFRRRRRTHGWRRHWRALLAAVLVVGLLAAGAWVVLFSSYLTARGVEVVGAAAVGTERVGAAAQLPAGVPLARIDLDGVRERVEGIAAVESAEVSRSWPHTVRVQVTPRTPVALVAGGDGLVAIDGEGARFEAPAEATAGLPRVELAEGVDAEGVTEAGRVLAALPADLAGRTETVRVGSVDGISLVMRSGRTVVWGSAEQSETKAEVLDALLRNLPRAVTEIDVTVPGKPTTR
ncbi:cell division protein FtsQ/DivIB [Nocardioides aequoreus]|uniref:cell division protein FtsQ/DivIB n=1 Tax=Nocardioides aequoreus TaxID=397278 RepID=UPI0004C40843|nr:FtsQ-type POTRA domain-containing protein [Nocardioides aequoreus]